MNEERFTIELKKNIMEKGYISLSEIGRIFGGRVTLDVRRRYIKSLLARKVISLFNDPTHHFVGKPRTLYILYGDNPYNIL